MTGVQVGDHPEESSMLSWWCFSLLLGIVDIAMYGGPSGDDQVDCSLGWRWIYVLVNMMSRCSVNITLSAHCRWTQSHAAFGLHEIGLVMPVILPSVFRARKWRRIETIDVDVGRSRPAGRTSAGIRPVAVVAHERLPFPTPRQPGAAHWFLDQVAGTMSQFFVTLPYLVSAGPSPRPGCSVDGPADAFCR